MKLNIYSLKFNIRFYFTVVVFTTLLFVICLQFFAIKLYFPHMKQEDVKSVAKKVIEICKESNYESVLNSETNAKADINIALFDVYGGAMWSNNENFYEKDYLSEFRQSIIKSDEPISGIISRDGRDIAYYGYRFMQNTAEGEQKSVYIYATSLINVNSSTVSILVTQWIILSAAVFLLSVLVIFFIAKKLMEPIERLTNNVQQLATRDYEVNFDSTGYTEIDKLSESLTMTAKQLSETDELKNELLANVTHDFKTPLTLIKSYAEMIRDLSGDNKEKRNEHLAVIMSEADKLTLMVNDIIDLSKSESKNNELTPVNFNISEVAHECCNNFLSFKEYTFDIDIEDNLYVFADKKSITQVINNLISNAVNYSGNEKYIKVSVHSVDMQYIRVDIIDHGEGIAEDEINNIWDRYYRSKMKHQREVAGTGLGLSIVRNILRNHKAEYGVNSELGKGSDFYFILNKADNN